MKKGYARGLSLVLVLVFTMSLCISAGAADISPRASDYIDKYGGSVAAKGDGVLKISFSVVGTRMLDEIGASLISVQEKRGTTWKTVAAYNNEDMPELSTVNNYSYGAYVLYEGEAGVTYRAKITVFGNTDDRTFTTASTVAT